jgi:hypothetical protein
MQARDNSRPGQEDRVSKRRRTLKQCEEESPETNLDASATVSLLRVFEVSANRREISNMHRISELKNVNAAL